MKGDLAADPSTYTCFKQTLGRMDCPATWPPFWGPPPRGAVFNGSALINGVRCNRFDFSMGMGAQTFWATAAAPCRALTTEQREDYLTFDTTAPPSSAFDGPVWLKGLKCTHVTTGASPKLRPQHAHASLLPLPHRPLRPKRSRSAGSCFPGFSEACCNALAVAEAMPAFKQASGELEGAAGEAAGEALAVCTAASAPCTFRLPNGSSTANASCCAADGFPFWSAGAPAKAMR